ncbi:MAG TPA: sodium/proton-translocating pyrophosphatase, partial [Chloroflexota bacterium]|nr:sodium/proton-translocating pyrophosphatase [Chloroflexota bacterium]
HSMMGSAWSAFFVCGLIGIGVGFAFVYITQYYTAGAWRPVQEIARACMTGPATTIITGTAVGFETTAVTAVVIGVALVAAFMIGGLSGLVNGNIYGTAVATMSMLMSASYVLAMDTFGPITDNAGGITEFAHASPEARQITDSLDAVGNTTKALTKGYAVASAGLAAFLLFSAYLDRIKELLGCTNPTAAPPPRLVGVIAHCGDSLPVDLSHVEVFVGALLGGMLVFLFSSLAIRAVGSTAAKIIEEVRRQFREDPGIMQGTSKPDYARAVDITARAALREMVAPGLLAVFMPVVVGLIFRATGNLNGNAGWESVGGLLMVGTIVGVIVATFFNNSGGAWDNAKKFIESGQLKDAAGVVQGKGSFAHAAGVVGDTVGDPFKDTAGPSLHVLVKLLSTITLVLAPLFV